MPRTVTHPSDLYGLYEAFDTSTHEFLYTLSQSLMTMMFSTLAN
jgi:hypothetical protein